MDGSDVMFDYIDNLKFMENSAYGGTMVELPYSNNPDLLAALSHHAGHLPGNVLTMVMKPGGGVTHQSSSSGGSGGGKITSIYSPIFQSVGMPTLSHYTSSSHMGKFLSIRVA